MLDEEMVGYASITVDRSLAPLVKSSAVAYRCSNQEFRNLKHKEASCI